MLLLSLWSCIVSINAYIYEFEFDIIDQEIEEDSLQAVIALTEVST